MNYFLIVYDMMCFSYFVGRACEKYTEKSRKTERRKE